MVISFKPQAYACNNQQNTRKGPRILKKQGFLLSSAILIITVIITKVLGLIYKIPLTNILGGTGYGYYSIAYSVFMPVFSVAVSGISTSMSRLVSENAAFERYRNIKKIRRTALLFFSASGIAFTLLSFIIALPVCVFIVKEPSALWSVIAISPCIFIGAVTAVECGYYEGLRNMTPTAVSEIIEGVFKIVFGLGFAYYALKNIDRYFIKGLPFVSAMSVLGVTLANLISCAYLVISHRIKGDGITKEMLEADRCVEPMRKLLKNILRISAPIALASVITTLGSFVDTITIGRCLKTAVSSDPELFLEKFGPSADLKSLPNFIYGSFTGLALTVFGLVPSLTSIFSKSILPVISEDISKGRKNDVSKRINSVLFVTALIAIPSAMGIFTFSDEILLLLFPNKKTEILAGSSVLKILCAGMIFLCLAMPLFSIVQAISKPKASVRIMLGASIIKMILNMLLVSVPKLNILGAGIATTASYGVIFLRSLYEIIRTGEVRIMYKKIIFKPFFASLLCIAGAKIAFDFLLLRTNTAISLGLGVLFGVIIYIFSLYLLSVLNKNELKCLFFK